MRRVVQDFQSCINTLEKCEKRKTTPLLSPAPPFFACEVPPLRLGLSLAEVKARTFSSEKHPIKIRKSSCRAKMLTYLRILPS